MAISSFRDLGYALLPGARIKIVDEWVPDEHGTMSWNPNGLMDKYLGCIVTIKSGPYFLNDKTEYYKIEEDQEDTYLLELNGLHGWQWFSEMVDWDWVNAQNALPELPEVQDFLLFDLLNPD